MPIFYSAAPSIVRSAGMEIKRTRELPFRDELCYWLVPWKHNENSAELFAAAALKQASPDGVILADSTSDEAIVLVQMRDGLGEAVAVQFDGGPLTPYDQDPQAFRRELGKRELYAVAPMAGHAPKRLLADEKLGRVRFHRGKEQVLYEVQFTGHPPRQ